MLFVKLRFSKSRSIFAQSDMLYVTFVVEVGLEEVEEVEEVDEVPVVLLGVDVGELPPGNLM